MAGSSNKKEEKVVEEAAPTTVNADQLAAEREAPVPGIDGAPVVVNEQVLQPGQDASLNYQASEAYRQSLQPQAPIAPPEPETLKSTKEWFVDSRGRAFRRSHILAVERTFDGKNSATNRLVVTVTGGARLDVFVDNVDEAFADLTGGK